MTLAQWQAAHPGIRVRIQTNRITLATLYGNGWNETSAFTSGQTGNLTDPALMARLDATYTALVAAHTTSMNALRASERTKLLNRLRVACDWLRANGYDPNDVPARSEWATVRATLSGRETLILDQLYVDGVYENVWVPHDGGAIYGWVPDPCSADGHPGITVTVAEAEA